ncbi:MAG: UvrD-helicase domain-containing protein [Prevotellaceae bacterium]|jgi:ATP-dependent exoDNAse (exonuclease V) beta subunit|nr:UvrD-helicase domain-containing protein [Prevotellaceae bacterium]
MYDNFRQSNILNQGNSSSKVKKDKGLTVYRASAGAGKTYALTKEYLKQALAGNNENAFRSLLAITFTNKATEEMKSRIINMLNGIAVGDESAASMIADLLSETGIDLPGLKKRAENARTALLHDFSRFSVSTIDKFFQKVLHAFVREAGLRPGFKLELDSERLLNEAVDRLVLSLPEKTFLYQWLFGLIDEQLEHGDAWDLRGVLKEKGKMVFDENFRSFDLEFHKKTGDAEFMTDYRKKLETIINNFDVEMKSVGTQALETIESKNIEKSDFANGERGAVSYFSKICKGEYVPGKRALSVEQWHKKKYPKGKDADLIIQAIEGISETLDNLLQKALSVYDDYYQDYITANCILKEVKMLRFLSEIETNVRNVANEENSMPISETVHLLEKLIGGNETPFVYERIGNRYDSFMIDEFQDTSEGQWHNLKPLIDNSLAGNKFSMVVGDVKQSIYRWRNGDWKILANIENNFQNFGITEKKLEKNYRSDGLVIEFNNYLFDKLPEWIEKEFNHNADGKYSTDMLSKAYNNSGQKMRDDKAEKGYICVSCVFDEDEKKNEEKISEELPLLVAEIQDRGYRAGDIAVLVRKSADGQKVGDCLMEYKRTSGDTNHNFNIVSNDSLCVKRSEIVRFIIALLRATVNPDDQVNAIFINRILMKKSFKEFSPELKILSNEIKKLLNGLASLSLPEIFEELLAKFDLGADADEVSFLQEFHDELVRFSCDELSDISAFLEYWDKDNGGQNLKLSSDKAPDAIRIITIHKSKGLEFPVVIIPYCDWDMKPRGTIWVNPKKAPFNELSQVPVKYVKELKDSHFYEEYFQETAQSFVDNLNLMYVAFTRAREELHVMLPLPKGALEDKDSDKIKNAAATLFEFFKQEGRWNADYQYISGEKHKIIIKTESVERNEISVKKYPASNFKKQLKIRYESDDYFSDSSSSLNLRNYGNLMHRVFAMLKTADDLPRAIDTLVKEGIIDKSEVAELTARIDKAMKNSHASSWFASEQGLETERFLLLPANEQNGASRRPDRVIVRPNETLIIDYKFGQTEKENHKQQVREYVNLLITMGYPQVKGYVWYVDADKVREVN